MSGLGLEAAGSGTAYEGALQGMSGPSPYNPNP